MAKYSFKVIPLFFALILTFNAKAALPSENHLSCEELLAIESLTATVHISLVQVEEYSPLVWNDAIISTLLALIDKFQIPSLDFAYFEKLFRREYLPYYLVADSAAVPLGYYVGYPDELKAIRPNQHPRYHIWLGINAQSLADQLKAKMGIDDKENLLRLRETGVLMRIDGSRN